MARRKSLQQLINMYGSKQKPVLIRTPKSKYKAPKTPHIKIPKKK